MKRIRCLAAVFVLIFLLWVPIASGGTPSAAGKEGWPAHVKILTGASGGQWDAIGTSIADVLNRSVVSADNRLGGGISNVIKVHRGEGDIGFTVSSFLQSEKLKKEVYGGAAFNQAVLMTDIYPQILYIIVRKKFAKNHGIQTLEDLLQVRFPVRFATLRKGTASYFLVELLLRCGFNIDFDRLRVKGWQVHFNNYSEIADKFANEEMDCFAYTAGSEVPLILSMEKYVGITVLPIPHKVLDRLWERYAIHTYTILPGTYKSITTPIHTLSDYACLVVRKDLPEELVYRINKAIWENRTYIGAGMKDFLTICPRKATKGSLTIHPGSLRFWRELQNKDKD